MFGKILIANRGEIALRVVRTCVEMGVKTVVAHSTADADRIAAQYATETVCIGGPQPSQSYLNMDSLISAALSTGCDAIHPGFGFLSENPTFAQKCEEFGLVFIGPAPDVISKLGDKATARRMAQESNVPVVPGSKGVVANAAEALEIANEIGYPVLLKASMGGGGRGMRRVNAPEQLPAAYDSARAEALSAFGDGSLYVEKLILDPHHVEIQILADNHGNVIHLGERECSVQRNNQKLIEESPSPALNPQMRQAMGHAAISLAKNCGYTGAGTVEFVVSGENFYFIEMNARIQVEHPVTEMRCGMDLVREQLRIASGLSLGITQDDVQLNGHSIECRIVAEDPAAGFRPNPGTIDFLHFPGGNGVRVDSDLHVGATVSPYYDSMIAKIIVHAPNRQMAVRKMRRALEETIVEGVNTNLNLLLLICFNTAFIRGAYTTSFLTHNLKELLSIDRVANMLEPEIDTLSALEAAEAADQMEETAEELTKAINQANAAAAAKAMAEAKASTEAEGPSASFASQSFTISVESTTITASGEER